MGFRTMTSAARRARPGPSPRLGQARGDCELGYFGGVFGGPAEDPPGWRESESEPGIDMWATADESRDDVIGVHERAWVHSDATIGALDLDDVGSGRGVPRTGRSLPTGS